jgi:hypothetical protein
MRSRQRSVDTPAAPSSGSIGTILWFARFELASCDTPHIADLAATASEELS